MADGLENVIVTLYAKGMSASDIEEQIGKSGQTDHPYPIDIDHLNPEQTDHPYPVQIDQSLSCN